MKDIDTLNRHGIVRTRNSRRDGSGRAWMEVSNSKNGLGLNVCQDFSPPGLPLVPTAHISMIEFGVTEGHKGR